MQHFDGARLSPNSVRNAIWHALNEPVCQYLWMRNLCCSTVYTDNSLANDSPCISHHSDYQTLQTMYRTQDQISYSDLSSCFTFTDPSYHILLPFFTVHKYTHELNVLPTTSTRTYSSHHLQPHKCSSSHFNTNTSTINLMCGWPCIVI